MTRFLKLSTLHDSSPRSRHDARQLTDLGKYACLTVSHMRNLSAGAPGIAFHFARRTRLLGSLTVRQAMNPQEKPSSLCRHPGEFNGDGGRRPFSSVSTTPAHSLPCGPPPPQASKQVPTNQPTEPPLLSHVTPARPGAPGTRAASDNKPHAMCQIWCGRYTHGELNPKQLAQKGRD